MVRNDRREMPSQKRPEGPRSVIMAGLSWGGAAREEGRRRDSHQELV
jgi:hypothetical protein